MATERANGGGWRATAGLVAILALATGWFLMSWTMMHTAVVDALGEAAGVAFALLVVVSVIGAVRGARRGDDPN
jgi:membrane protein implicated in regulation of membrane protease activity